MTQEQTTITPEELYAKVLAGEEVEMIDVRTGAEYREVHATLARLEPLDSLDPERLMRGRRLGKEAPLYVICRSGSRGRMACEKLRGAGYGKVVNVDGGTLAWERAGLPVTRGKKTISLERQVRIAAGLLVVLGTALGAFVNPWFLGLAAFVGAGLVFAGVTDTCGMGMLLAKMPWNRVSEGADSCCAK
jgi:rhodanese-related sulfurtransferase